MRVVAGKYRGKKLQEFELSSTRPTTDRVKESIFNLIQFDCLDAVVLDLFAGTGSLGIEAISRGANKTYFVDENKDAIKIINDNLKGIEANYKIIQSDYENFLTSTNEKFDIVLLDPPYKTEYGTKAISYLISNNKLNSKAIIIFETSEEKQFDFEFKGFNVKKKKYGAIAVYKIEKID